MPSPIAATALLEPIVRKPFPKPAAQFAARAFRAPFRFPIRIVRSRITKVTLPGPSLFVNFWSPDRSQSAYASLEGFLTDAVAILRNEVAELVRLGATYIQIDAPHYALLLAPETRAFYESRGWTFDQWLSRGIELDNAVMAGFAGVTFAIHLCRGNQESRWLV